MLPVTEQLSEREKEVVVLLAKSYCIKEIADALVISPGTVRKHLDNIRDKLNVRKGSGIVLYCLGAGIIKIE